MLKDYLSVAQDALRTQQELYHVKEQRLALVIIPPNWTRRNGGGILFAHLETDQIVVLIRFFS